MDLRNFEFLCFGLIAAWLIVVVYVIVLAQRGRRMRFELGRVKQMLEEREMRR